MTYQVDHAANARGIRSALEQSAIKISVLQREYGAAAYAAQRGDASSLTRARKLQQEIAALETSMAEQRAAAEAAEAAASVQEHDGNREAVARDVSNAKKLLDEAEELACALEAAIADAAIIAARLTQKREGAFSLVAKHVGYERSHVMALHSLAPWILGRFVRLAGFQGENPVDMHEPIDALTRQDHERVRCRLPDLVPSGEA